MKTTGALLAAATVSNKKVNQDAYALARNRKAPLAAIVVSDGLGSHFGAEIASRLAAETIRRGLEALQSPCEIDMVSLFAKAWQGLERYVNEHAAELPPDLDWGNAFGTTVLCAAETRDEVVLGYLGNGAIFHIRGDFNAFPKSQLLPWTAVNYLNPHTKSQGGKNVLYKFLSIRSGPVETMPAVLKVRKDMELLGDIFLVCSDGIYSYDQTPMGRDSEQHIWISGEPAMALFFEGLASFFAAGDFTDEALAATLDQYLAELNSRSLVTDDCTLGVLITERAIRYQEDLANRRVKAVVS